MLNICRGHGEYWTFVGGTGNAGHSETHELIIHHALYDKSLRYQIVMRNTKNRQNIDQKKKNKRTNNDLQNTTPKTKDRVTRTPLKIGDELMCSGRVSIIVVLFMKILKLYARVISHISVGPE
jgi:hypothetical protein